MTTRHPALAPFVVSTAAAEFGAYMARLPGVELSPSARQALHLAATLAMVRNEQGHAYLDFTAPVLLPRRIGGSDDAARAEGASRAARAMTEVVAFEGHRELRPMLQDPAVAPVVTSAGESNVHPREGALLVLDGPRLYLRRSWEDETWLADWLRQRLRAAAPRTPDWLEPLLHAAFPAGSPAEQINAARACLHRPLSVVTGGPGTGKTFVVARLLLAQGVAHTLRSGAAPRILLLAPTGKAARRVDVSVAAAVETLRQPMLALAERAGDPLRRVLPQVLQRLENLRGQASTMHAALETDWRGAGLFQRGAQQPLHADVVVVDEASMVALSLMRALCAAVPPDAQLVLLGDHGQLQSVEAGSVLSDIVAGEDELAESAGASVNVQLRDSRRFPRESGLGRLAHAIRTGECNARGEPLALELLEQDPQVRAQVTLVEPEPGRSTALAVELAAERLAALRDRHRSPEERLRVLESFALLCAHRRGPGGADDVNSALVRRLGGRSAIRGGAPGYDGMPVLILHNSRDTGLANGDLGVICTDAAGELMAHMDGGRAVHVRMLPEYAPAYALTVHKSQGSEYGSVGLVLPEYESPVLTRELIYTALTRWKAGGQGGGARGVTIIACRAVLDAALRTGVQRASGLRERLA